MPNQVLGDNKTDIPFNPIAWKPVIEGFSVFETVMGLRFI